MTEASILLSPFKNLKVLLMMTVMRLFKRSSRIEEYDIHSTYFSRPFVSPSLSQIGDHIASGGFWDKNILDFVAAELPPHPVVVDVGANIGATSIYIINKMSPSRIVAVEASSRYLPYLSKNLASYDDIDIYPNLLASELGLKVTMATNGTTGTPTVSDEYGLDLTSRETMSSHTLSSMCMDLNISKIDFLKIDTDGFEVDVLSGGKDLVLSSRPVILLEYSPNSIKRVRNPSDLFTVLHELGYFKFDVFDPSGVLLSSDVGSEAEIDNLIDQHNIYYVDLVCR